MGLADNIHTAIMNQHACLAPRALRTYRRSIKLRMDRKASATLTLFVLATAGRAETDYEIKKRLLANYAGKRGSRPSMDAELFKEGEGCRAVPAPDIVTTQISVDRFHALDMRNQKFGFVGCVLPPPCSFSFHAHAWWTAF